MDEQTIEDVCRNQLHIHYLKPYQELIIHQILDNEEEGRKTKLLGCLPTGSGKSLCFMIPILLLKKPTIIVYPLLSLMADQARRFEESGIPYILLKGGMTKDEKKKALASFAKGEKLTCIINMEMLLCLTKNNELASLKNKISLFVIDEAHTTVTWGNTFRKSYQELDKVITFLNPQHILAFTATMDNDIRKGIIGRIFQNARPYIVHASSDRENIFYHAVKSANKIEDIIQILSPKIRRPAIVFCNSREKTQEIAKSLSERGFECVHYHAGLSKEERKEKEQWFFHSETGILVGTSAYGMGVSKNGIRTVIHLELPTDASSFLQESGRAGRDGNPADSFVLYSSQEESPLGDIFSGTKCIRTQLLEKMNEHTDVGGCFACSHCVEDNYMPAGKKQVLQYLHHRSLISTERMQKYLLGHHVFRMNRRLPDWDAKSFQKLLFLLEGEGTIRRRGKYLKKVKASMRNNFK